jgi:hypothetical protein
MDAPVEEVDAVQASLYEEMLSGELIPWWLALLVILVSGALVSWGVRLMVSRWEKEDGVGPKASIAGDLSAIIVAALCGAGIGLHLWHWIPGAMSAVVGALGNPIVLRYAKRYADKKVPR